jgi:hypothetical protein
MTKSYRAAYLRRRIALMLPYARWGGRKKSPRLRSLSRSALKRVLSRLSAAYLSRLLHALEGSRQPTLLRRMLFEGGEREADIR